MNRAIRASLFWMLIFLGASLGCRTAEPRFFKPSSRHDYYMPLVAEAVPTRTAEPVAEALPTQEIPPQPLPADPEMTTNSVQPLGELTSELNGIPVSEIVVLPPETIDTVREIFATGQELGNNPHGFSKIGDSTIESPFFLDRYDEGPYNLGDYTYLQPIIDYYRGSFSRQGEAVFRGLHTWTMFDPMWASSDACEPNETPVECEFRLNRPSIVFIRVGSNDVGRSDLFESNMTRLIELCFEKGIIPIIGTKADRNEGSDANNEFLRDLAENYDIPLWDFDRIAGTLPNRGVSEDGVHLTTFYTHDYRLPDALQTGYGVHNLTALMMLYELWRNLPITP